MMENMNNNNTLNTAADCFSDLRQMHTKFKVHDWFEANKDNKELMAKYLTFRLNMCLEELLETAEAAGLCLSDDDHDGVGFIRNTNKVDPEEVVDGLIDLCVFAIGTLDVFDVDGGKAWVAVHNANMAKKPGVKEGRPNPFGLPDLLKPEGWTAPSHEGNHGSISNII